MSGKDLIVDFALEDVEETEDKFIFTARSITKDFVCEKGLERISNDSPGKPLIWRHEHPIIPEFTKSTHIFGRVLESHVEKGDIFSKYQVYGHTQAHLDVRNIIKKRDELNKPIKISLRFRQYGPDESPIHFDVIEHSLTPTPACKECKVIDILNESDNMPEEEKDEYEQELMKSIRELEEKLTKKDKILEELESKIVTLEKTIEDSEKEIESERTEKDEISEQILELNDKVKEQSIIIDKLHEKIKMKEVEPVINNLIELDGKDMEELYRMKVRDSIADDKKFEEVKNFLSKRAKELESAPHAQVEDLSSTAQKSQFKDEELEDEKQKAQRDVKAFANMPKEFFEKRGAK